jgi:hypothetical protein
MKQEKGWNEARNRNRARPFDNPAVHLAVHSFASRVSANSQHESELIPTAVIIRLVDAHSIVKQANDECDRSNNSMPESAPKAGRLCAWLVVGRNRPSNGEDIWHGGLQVYKKGRRVTKSKNC